MDLWTRGSDLELGAHRSGRAAESELRDLAISTRADQVALTGTWRRGAAPTIRRRHQGVECPDRRSHPGHLRMAVARRTGRP